MNIWFGDNNVADTMQRKYPYTYNTNGQIVESKCWYNTAASVTDSTSWIYVGYWTFSYTEIGNMDTLVMYGASNVPNFRLIYTYNENGYAVTELQQTVGNIYNLAHGIDSIAVWVITD